MNTSIFYFLLGIVFVWILSYFYNYQSSRGKLTRIARWLNDGLSIFGGNPTSRWQGFNTLQILLNGGRGVFSDGAIIIGTESKELFAALVSLIRGGRDSLNFIFSLRPAPLIVNTFEIFEPQGQIPRVVALSKTGEWQVENTSNDLYRIAYRTVGGRESALRLITLLTDYGLQIRRISVRTEAPHLLLSFNLRGQLNVEAHEFLGTIRTLAEESVRGATPSMPVTKDRPNNGRGTKLTGVDKRPKKPTKAKRNQESLPLINVNDPLTPRFGPPLSPYYEPDVTRNFDNNPGKN